MIVNNAWYLTNPDALVEAIVALGVVLIAIVVAIDVILGVELEDAP